MLTVAQKAQKLDAADPRYCWSEAVTHRIVALHCSRATGTSSNGNLGVIDIYMRRDKQGRPDFKEPVYEDVSSYFKDTRRSSGVSSSSSTSSGETDLVAPGGAKFANGSITDPDDGWVGFSAGSTSMPGYNTAGYAYDTTDSQEYSADAVGNPTNSVATARYIINSILKGQGGDLSDAASVITRGY